MTLKNEQGLWIDTDTNTVLGYLVDFQGHGVYSPDGKVELTKEQADTHNRLLAEAEIKGMDDNCQVGQMGTFYYIKGQVQTFTGVVVDAHPTVNGKSITFSRNGRKFRGTLRKDADCFNFKRIY